jgi:hypothetical protein
VRPTIKRVRARLGRGSANRINPLLDTWWKALAYRMPQVAEAYERIPPVAIHALTVVP